MCHHCVAQQSLQNAAPLQPGQASSLCVGALEPHVQVLGSILLHSWSATVSIKRAVTVLFRCSPTGKALDATVQPHLCAKISEALQHLPGIPAPIPVIPGVNPCRVACRTRRLADDRKVGGGDASQLSPGDEPQIGKPGLTPGCPLLAGLQDALAVYISSRLVTGRYPGVHFELSGADAPVSACSPLPPRRLDPDPGLLSPTGLVAWHRQDITFLACSRLVGHVLSASCGAHACKPCIAP